MLPQVADSGRFPATPRLGSGRVASHPEREVLLDIPGDGGPGTLEIKTAGQLFGNQRIVEGFAKRQKLLQKALHRLGPSLFVVAPRGVKDQRLLSAQPLSAQALELCPTNLQALGGGLPVHLALIEGLKNLADQFRTDSMR